MNEIIPITETLHIKRKKIHQALQGHLYSVTSVIFKREGNQLISGGWDGTVKVFDIDNKEQLDVLMVFDDAIERLELSSDERWLAIGVSDSLYIIDLTSDTKNVIRLSPDYPVRSAILAFSWNSKYITCATYEDSIKIFDIESGNEITEYMTSALGGNYCLSFSRDDSFIAIGQMNEEITFYYWEEGKAQVFESSDADGHSGPIQALSFSSSGYMITGGMDSKIKIWDINQRKIITTILSKGPIITADFASMGQVIAGGSERSTKIVSLSSGTVISMEHPITTSNVSVSIDGKYVARGMGDNRISIWDVQNGKLYKEIKGHNETINDVIFTETNSNFITASADKSIHVLDLEGSDIHLLKGHKEGVACVAAVEAANTIISAGADDRLIFWDMITWSKKLVIDLFEQNKGEIVSSIAVIDGKIFLASGGDYLIREFNFNGEVIKTFEGHDDYINEIAVDPEGKYLASAGDDQKVIVWDLQGNKYLVIECENKVNAVSFDYTGSRLAIGTGENLIIYNLMNKKKFFEFSVYQGNISSIAFATTHEYLIFGNRHNINMLDLTSLEDPDIITLASHLDKITKVGFFPDGNQFYSLSFDKECFIFNFAEPEEAIADVVEEVVSGEEMTEEVTTTVETVDTSLFGDITSLEDTGYYDVEEKAVETKLGEKIEVKFDSISSIDKETVIISNEEEDSKEDFLTLIDSVLDEKEEKIKAKLVTKTEKIDFKRTFINIKIEMEKIEELISENPQTETIFNDIKKKLQYLESLLSK